MNSADDLIVEENEDVIKALKRLSPQDSYDRVYRIRRAMQCSLSHKLLPKEEWTKLDEVRSLSHLSMVLCRISHGRGVPSLRKTL